MAPPQRPRMTNAGLQSTFPVIAVDEYGEAREGFVAGEQPLTLYLDKREVVTLMTLGTHPELLVLGYLRNQHLVGEIETIDSVEIDWATEAAVVTTRGTPADLESRLAHRTLTTGCGQGTLFGRLTEVLERIGLPQVGILQSQIYALLERVGAHNQVYRRAGVVHGCALCHGEVIELFVEDVGRHNAADTLAGYLWLQGLRGEDRVLYTTGRVTSEMVIKVAQMGVPILVSRSGVTHKGLELARKAGLMVIARAKGRHFLIYHGAEGVQFDAVPERRVSGCGAGTEKL